MANRYPMARRALVAVVALLGAVFLAAELSRDHSENKPEIPQDRPSGGSGNSPEQQRDSIDVASLYTRHLPDLSPRIFGIPVPPPVQPSEIVPPPVKPMAPPLPYVYLGQYRDADGSQVFYLRREDRVVVAQAGKKLDETYALDFDANKGLIFTYLPLKEVQVLPIGITPP